MQHNTKFSKKMFGDLENINWTNTDIMTLHCDLDLECSNPFFFPGHWLMMMDHDTKIGCHGINSSEGIIERVDDESGALPTNYVAVRFRHFKVRVCFRLGDSRTPTSHVPCG